MKCAVFYHQDFTDNELVTLAIQYLINKQHLQERMAENEANQQQLVPATEEDETNAKNWKDSWDSQPD